MSNASESRKFLEERTLTKIINGAMTMSKSYRMWPQSNDWFPIFAESQVGCEMTVADGRIFIDCMGGLGTSFLPLSVIKKDVIEQLKKGINFSLPTKLETELAEIMCEIYPGCESVRFCKNGSDATSAAIRIARSFKKKDYILMASGGYHGWSDQFCSISLRKYGMPEAFGQFVDFFDFNNVDSLKTKIETGKYACVIMEPVIFDEPKDNFLQKVRDLCTANDTLLIFDEVVTCRWSLGGAQEYFGVTPDITCVGKAIAGGATFAAVFGKKEYMKELENVFFSATYFGNCFDLCAALSTLKYFKKNKDKMFKSMWKNGKLFKKKFNQKCKELGIDGEVMGMSPRMAVKFNYPNFTELRDVWHQENIKNGIFMGIAIYITPMHKKKHMDKIISTMDVALRKVAEAINAGDAKPFIDGTPSEVIFKRQ